MIELMVVVAIISVLAALLTAGLAQGKVPARRTQCLNHHRQLQMAWHLFADDHAGELPPNADGPGKDELFTNWVGGNVESPAGAQDAAILVNPEYSLLAGYVREARLYKCPSDRSLKVRSVSMNNRLNPVSENATAACTGGWGTNWMVYRRESDLHNPSGIFVFVDERSDSINEGYFAVDLSNTGTYGGEGSSAPYWWIDTPAGYHGKAGMFSFADGHVEAHQWVEPSTWELNGITGPRYTGLKDRDIQWVQQHTAEKK